MKYPAEDEIIDTILECVDIRGIDLSLYRRQFTEEYSGLISALNNLYERAQYDPKATLDKIKSYDNFPITLSERTLFLMEIEPNGKRRVISKLNKNHVLVEVFKSGKLVNEYFVEYENLLPETLEKIAMMIEDIEPEGEKIQKK
jgi:hypothetical protein